MAWAGRFGVGAGGMRPSSCLPACLFQLPPTHHYAPSALCSDPAGPRRGGGARAGRGQPAAPGGGQGTRRPGRRLFSHPPRTRAGGGGCGGGAVSCPAGGTRALRNPCICTRVCTTASTPAAMRCPRSCISHLPAPIALVHLPCDQRYKHHVSRRGHAPDNECACMHRCMQKRRRPAQRTQRVVPCASIPQVHLLATSNDGPAAPRTLHRPCPAVLPEQRKSARRRRCRSTGTR